MSERTFSYQPGGWFGIVGEHATVLLPGTEKARAGALWALVDDGAGFDAVLDALVAGGLSSLPGFVLLASDGDTTRVVIRGEASATLESAEGTVHVAGSTTSMWVERVLQEVTRLSVTLPDELPAGPRLSVVSGLVRLAGLETPAPRPALAVPPPPSTPPPPPRLELVPDPLTDDLDLLGDEDLARGADEGAGPVPVADDDTPTDGDVLGGPPAWTPATPPPPPPTTLPPIPPPGIPPVPGFPPPPPAAPSAWDDEPTEQMAAVPVDLGDAERAPERQPGSEPNSEHESEPEPEWERPAPVAHLSFSSGDEVDVDGLVVIGRAPDAGRFPADEEPTLVTVPSPHSEISSTHVEVRPGTGADHGSAVVTDLGSTNGTLLVQPGQRPEELRPGVPVVLQSGAMIDLGDGLTIRVSKI